MLLALAPELDLKYQTLYSYLNNDVTRNDRFAIWPCASFHFQRIGSGTGSGWAPGQLCFALACFERNPFARAQRFPHGLLLEVCESPWEALTLEGVQRLIQATESMPPLPERAAEPKPPAPQAQRSRIHAEQLKIAGFSGFYDRLTRVFWITENLVPPSILDRTTQEGIHRIRDSKEPVSGVRVLFSTREAAELNKDLLQGLEAEAWYVSAVTGKPQRA